MRSWEAFWEPIASVLQRDDKKNLKNFITNFKERCVFVVVPVVAVGAIVAFGPRTECCFRPFWRLLGIVGGHV